MSAQILDGKALAASIKKDLAARTTALKAKGITPGLGTVLVGDDPGSHSYVSGKHRDCQEVGINSIRVDLPATATQADVLAAIKDLNSAKECTGYIVQLPLPKGINTQVILEAIDPDKDADGLHPMNLGRLVAGYDAPLPCTPRGIVELINHYKISLAGAEVVVIGRGLTAMKPNPFSELNHLTVPVAIFFTIPSICVGVREFLELPVFVLRSAIPSKEVNLTTGTDKASD